MHARPRSCTTGVLVLKQVVLPLMSLQRNPTKVQKQHLQYTSQVLSVSICQQPVAEAAVAAGAHALPHGGFPRVFPPLPRIPPMCFWKGRGRPQAPALARAALV